MSSATDSFMHFFFLSKDNQNYYWFLAMPYLSFGILPLSAQMSESWPFCIDLSSFGVKSSSACVTHAYSTFRTRTHPFSSHSVVMGTEIVDSKIPKVSACAYYPVSSFSFPIYCSKISRVCSHRN